MGRTRRVRPELVKKGNALFDKRDFAPTRAFSRMKCVKTHSLRVKYFSRRTRPTEVPLGGAAVKNRWNTIRGLRAANSARPFDSLWADPAGPPFLRFFCNFLLQVPAEYDINGVLKCFEREVLRRKPAQERTGRRLQAGLSGAAVFARELPRGNARTGRPPLSGKRVRGSVPRSWVVPRKPYAFRPK